MYGQITAGSWIGTQGVIQGTYEIFYSLAKQHFGDTSRRKMIVSTVPGRVDVAQRLPITLNEGVAIIAEIHKNRIQRRIQTNYFHVTSDSTEESVKMALKYKNEDKPTSVHDELNGYLPKGISFQEALKLRNSNPQDYIPRTLETIHKHCYYMVKFKKDRVYGNNIRKQAYKAGFKKAFLFDEFVKLYIRPLFREGEETFRWGALSANPKDIYETDNAILKLFPDDEELPARIYWLGYGKREKAGMYFNYLVEKSFLERLIVIGIGN
ncbi:MAG: hypothetical protein RMJ51_00265 [Candidatus Calescibacterium sp.]|nr:hypothetical protein [Candidatus Calescibacterium sp.]MDW8194669.1 hypothetical protein [Candidatus Calescibacterium sp.]